MALDEKEECFLPIESELRFGGKKFRLNPKKKQQKVGAGSILLEGTNFPASALPEAGDYILVIRVTDELAKKVATQTLSFTVH